MSHSFEDHHFAVSLRDERWRIDARNAVRTSDHREAGHALTIWNGALMSIRAFTSFTQDRSAVARVSPRELREMLDVSPEDSFGELEMHRLGTLAGPHDVIELRIRRETRVVARSDAETSVSSTLLIATLSNAGGSGSVVTSPENVERDVTTLIDNRGADGPEVDATKFPLLWRNGTGAVLLHELVGHPAERGLTPDRWPAWLVVRDEPERAGLMAEVDDTGNRPSPVTLSHGEMPQAYRRETFRDPPLRRMTNVVVRQENAPFDLPSERIEIHQVDGGSYDSLRDEIALTVNGAQLVEGGRRRSLATVRLRAGRAALMAGIAGASGEPVRYPGVICSREGQRVAVGSWSPDLLMLAQRV